MRTRTAFPAIVILLALAALGDRAAAQPRDIDALRERVERRFEVLAISDGVSLRPRDTSVGVRSIEVTSGPIAIDGVTVTGGELRTKLGTDADLVLEVSYLSDSDRRALAATPPPRESTAAPDADPDPVPSRPRPGRRSRDDDRVRIGGSVAVEAGEVINGDVVAVGGSARVDGTVRGGVVAVGGSVTLGPGAVVEDDVVVVGGVLRRAPEAQVRGKISEIGLGLDLDRLRWSGRPFWTGWGSLFGSAFALASTLMRLAVLCLFSALVVLLGQSYMERAGARAAAEPLKSWAVGFLAQLLFLPIMIIGCLLLIITIIGIPLLFLLVPFVLLALAVVGLVGFTGVAYHVGRLVSGRMRWPDGNPYATTIIGIVVLMTPVLLARLAGLGGGLLFPMTFGLGALGLVVEYLAWTIGFGAVALMRLQRSPSPPMAAAPAVQA
jgi:hypothetical protein